MPGYQPYRRGTILVPSGPSNDPDKRHLFVICTDKCEKGCFLIVPICTWINNLCDPTCILAEYEHSFLCRKSYVLYRNARIEDEDVLVKGVEQRVFTKHNDMNGQTFGKIRNGICLSPHTKRLIRAYFGCPPIGN